MATAKRQSVAFCYHSAWEAQPRTRTTAVAVICSILGGFRFVRFGSNNRDGSMLSV